jgi:hypothetical protein
MDQASGDYRSEPGGSYMHQPPPLRIFLSWPLEFTRGEVEEVRYGQTQERGTLMQGTFRRSRERYDRQRILDLQAGEITVRSNGSDLQWSGRYEEWNESDMQDALYEALKESYTKSRFPDWGKPIQAGIKEPVVAHTAPGFSVIPFTERINGIYIESVSVENLPLTSAELDARRRSENSSPY